MIRFTSIEPLYKAVSDAYLANGEHIFVILIGGCSRAGKSTLSSAIAGQLLKSDIESRVINIDAWLISVDKRKINSTVTERYDLEAINNTVESLLKGETVFPPVYNPASRKRIEGVFEKPIQLTTGVLIIEGVITLADKDLLAKSHFNIFVDIPDSLRIERLDDFYGRVKGLEKKVYSQIILDRENEEIPFVKASAGNADFLFNW